MRIQDKLRQSLLKKYGPEAVTNESQLEALASIPYGLSAQCLSLDLAIGRPGFPAGRLVEVVGLDGHSKSTHGYHLLAECQRLGGIGVLLESESAFETSRLTKIGIKTDDLIVCQPTSMEQALQMMDATIVRLREKEKFKGPLCVVWDSVAATPPSAEVAGDYDEDTMALAARVLSHGLRKLTRVVAKHKVVLVFLNQLKSSMARYGEPFVSYGGRAIKYHASLRVRVFTKKSNLEMNKKHEPVGVWVNADTIKNKLGPPFRQAEYYLKFSKGIDPYEDCLQAAVTMGMAKELKKGLIRWEKKMMQKRDFRVFVKETYKGPHTLRGILTKRALEGGFLKPYDTK